MINQTLKLGPGLRQDGDAIFVMKAARLSGERSLWLMLRRDFWRTHSGHRQPAFHLADSCVPLHNFDYVYNYLMDTNVSFIDCFEDPGPHGTGRYLDNMLPEIEKRDWRKGAQSIDVSVHVTSGDKEMVLHRPCLWNGVKRPCYLFARKFNQETLENMMQYISNYTI